MPNLVEKYLLTVKHSSSVLGSFGALPIFADLVHVVSRKQLIVERNKYSGIFILLSVYITGILSTSK